jgi:hypothetical protein
MFRSKKYKDNNNKILIMIYLKYKYPLFIYSFLNNFFH